MDVKKFFPKRVRSMINRTRSLKQNHATANGVSDARSSSAVDLRPSTSRSLSVPDPSLSLNNPKLDSNLQISVKKFHESEVIKCVVQNCTNLDSVVEFLISRTIKEQNSKQEAVLVFKFEVNQIFVDFGWKHSQHLNQKFQHKSVIIFVQSVIRDNFLIYWKSKHTLELFKLVPYEVKFSRNDSRICEFAVKFLKKSLKKGQLGLHSNFSLKDDGTKVQLHILANHHDHNLLMIAAKYGNINIVKDLLKYHINVEVLSVPDTAQSLAWKYGHHDIILELVSANFPYPKNMREAQCSPRLQQFLDISKELHSAINVNDLELIRTILKKNHNQRHFYDASNKSVLSNALLQEKWEIYHILVDHGCTFGPHESVDQIKVILNEEEREELQSIHAENNQHFPEKHMNILMENSFMLNAGKNVRAKLDKIWSAYKVLNESRYTKDILKVMAASKIFRIIFDFERDSVCRIDPYAEPGAYMLLSTTGRIIIGARQLMNQATENETFSVMAHEFCHYAMQLTFKNMAKPYKSNDKESMELFEKISENCIDRVEQEKIIEYVYRLYPEKFQHAELAACIPQSYMLKKDRPDKCADFLNNFKELVNYYVTTVIPAMENAAGNMDK